MARRYSSSGSPLGDEFQVNSYSTAGQVTPAVAMDNAGRFVVVWASLGQDGSGYGIFGQRYASDGTPLGGEFRVNTYTPGSQVHPSVDMTPEGHFVVALFGKEAPKQVAPEVMEKKGPNLGPLCDKRAAAAAPGAKLVGDYFEGAGNSIGHDDRSDFTVQLDAGKCYWMIACGEPDHIKSLSMYLWGPNNKRITEAKSDNPNPMIGHCANETGMFKWQVKITGGGGHFKAGLYKKQ